MVSACWVGRLFLFEAGSSNEQHAPGMLLTGLPPLLLLLLLQPTTRASAATTTICSGCTGAHP